MRNLILSTLSTLALLIYPLSLSAQNFSLSLDVDVAAGDQAVTSLNASADQVIAIQIFGKDIQNANGLAVRFEYDASQVTYQGFDVGSVLPGSPQVLAQQGTNPTSVEIGIASLGSQTTVSSGLVGTIRFRTIAGFSGTSIRLVHAQLSRGGQSETVTLTARVELGVSTAPSVDFDGDGTVGIPDFLEFVNHFGTMRGDAGYDAKYDLDSNGAIGIPDFLIFVDSFGSQVPPSGGGGGGGSSSPDLIVESPSVSNSTLTSGQSFTLSATVRNQGTGSSASTTLRYYRSSNATISTSDTEIGTDSVSGLSASGTSAESISLNAPSSTGTYYYGACVESVTGESNTDNNCSSNVTIRVNTQARGTGLSKLYWTDDTSVTDRDKIQRSNLTPLFEDLVTTGLRFLPNLVLDVTGGKMYWTDAGTNKIQRANLDGSNVEDLVTGLDDPRRLVLDVTGGKMYWTDAGTDKIQRANLDGSNVENLVTTGLDFPGSLVLDVTGGKMYWTDSGTDKIQRANLDGSNVEDLVTGLDDLRSLVLDVTGGKMYWTNRDKQTASIWVEVYRIFNTSYGYYEYKTVYTGGIGRADLDGSNRETVLNYTRTTFPRLLVLGVSAKRP